MPFTLYERTLITLLAAIEIPTPLPHINIPNEPSLAKTDLQTL
jgi:hypothetical protein